VMQAVGQFCCCQSDTSVLESGFQLDTCTYVVCHMSMQFSLHKILLVLAPAEYNYCVSWEGSVAI
jgi:hypothetical protein